MSWGCARVDVCSKATAPLGPVYRALFLTALIAIYVILAAFTLYE